MRLEWCARQVFHRDVVDRCPLLLLLPCQLRN
jgi:hypothetical protein